MNSINFTTQLTTRDFTNICIYKLVKHSKDWSQVAGIDLEADLIFVVDFESGIIDPLGGEVRVRGSNRVDEDGIDSLKAVQQCSSTAVQQCSSATVQQYSSAAVQQCSSAAVQQCSSATLQQCNSATVQQCSSAAVQQCNVAKNDTKRKFGGWGSSWNTILKNEKLIN